MGNIRGGGTGPLDPNAYQRLARFDTNQDGLSANELKQAAGGDNQIDRAEARRLGIDNNTRVRINSALQSAEGMDPNQVLFQKPPAQIQNVDRNIRNFMDYLRPLDSSGDQVHLQLSGEAGAGFGWLSGSVGGSAAMSITRAGDKFMVNINASGQAGVSAGRQTAAGGAQAGVFAGGSGGITYRFDSMQEVNDFLMHQVRENVPHADRIFPRLQDGPDMGHVQPFNTTQGLHYGGSVSGSVKLGKFNVSGAATFTRQHVNTRYPGTGRESRDTYSTGQVSFGVGAGNFSASISGSLTSAHIEYHPDPSKAGDFKTIDGNISLTFSASDKQKIAGGDTDFVRDRLTSIGQGLNLSGTALQRFVGGSLTRVTDAINSGRGSGVSGSVTVSFGLQAKWASDDMNLDADELEYFRLGTSVSVSGSAGFDIGVAHGNVSASARLTDWTDVDVTG